MTCDLRAGDDRLDGLDGVLDTRRVRRGDGDSEGLEGGELSDGCANAT